MRSLHGKAARPCGSGRRATHPPLAGARRGGWAATPTQSPEQKEKVEAAGHTSICQSSDGRVRRRDKLAPWLLCSVEGRSRAMAPVLAGGTSSHHGGAAPWLGRALGCAREKATFEARPASGRRARAGSGHGNLGAMG